MRCSRQLKISKPFCTALWLTPPANAIKDAAIAFSILCKPTSNFGGFKCAPEENINSSPS